MHRLYARMFSLFAIGLGACGAPVGIPATGITDAAGSGDMAGDATPVVDTLLVEVSLLEITNMLCLPGAVHCASSTTLSTCAADGSTWIASGCTNGNICITDACLPVICAPDESSCDGPSKVMWCNDTGTTLKLTETCNPATSGVCVNGHCMPVICQAGTKTCLDAVNFGVCKADGTGIDPQPCDDGDVCTIDACELAGSCTATVNSCNDGNPWTLDSCDQNTGCAHTMTACLTNADCDDQDACTLDTCSPGSPGGYGTCKNEQKCTCSVVGAIACGDANLSGNTESSDSSKFLSTWICKDGTVKGELGPEHVQQFVPSCTGAMTATLTYTSGGHLDLFLLDGSKQCWDNACLYHAIGNAGQTKLTATVVAGTVYNLAIDGKQSAGGMYTLDVSCTCP